MMNIRNQLATAAGAALSLWFVAESAFATDPSEYEFDDEIRSCIAEVAQRADYDDASRVRHEIVEVEPAQLGYALTIDTVVFTGTDVATRKYVSFCIAHRDNKPQRFRITRTGPGA